MADLNLEATALIRGSFASYPASRDAVVADAENAPYLCSLLNAFAAQFGAELRVSTEVTAGAAHVRAANVIVFHPNYVPAVLGGGVIAPALVPMIVAHELGHALLQNGLGPVNGTGRGGRLANPDEAVASSRINGQRRGNRATRPGHGVVRPAGLGSDNAAAGTGCEPGACAVGQLAAPMTVEADGEAGPPSCR